MKRVAFLVSRVVRTGPNTNMMAVLAHLPRSEVHPCVIALDGGSDPGLVEVLSGLGIELTCVPPGSLRSRLRWLRDRIRSESFDVVLSCGLRADLFNSVACPAPLRGMIKQEPAFTPFGGPMRTCAVRIAHLAILGRARHVVSVSDHVHTSLPRPLRGKSVVISNAVDLERFRPPTPQERSTARRALGITETAEVVVFAGTLDNRKRPHLLAAPVQMLDRRRQNVRLVIAGQGPLAEQLAREDSVQLVGFQEDVRSVYWAADVFALPSTHEGLPLAAMEAMACGLPLILSNIAPHTELLRGSTGVGEAVDVTDAGQVVSALERVLKGAPTPAPRQHAIENFGAETMAQTYARLFRVWATESPQLV